MNDYEKKQKRAERIFNAIETGIMIAVVAVFFIFSWQYGLLIVCWLIQNAIFYHKGKYEICIDEYELDGYSNLGLEKMLNSWRFFIPLMVGVALVMAFLSQVIGLAVLLLYMFGVFFYNTDC